VGRYGVDVASFERIGVAALREALGREGCIFIDEMGKMELCSAAFREAVQEVMDSGRTVVATIPLFRHPLLDRLREAPGATVFEVTPSNRNELPGRILALIESL
jgi:nucleoside-triphosphatase